MKYESTVKGPTFAAAMFGAGLQLGTFYYVWGNYTTAKDCISAPLSCMGMGSQVDPWGRLVLLVVLFTQIMWILSLRLIRETGASDSSIVDRLWSIMPWLYVWYALYFNPTPRLLLMAFVSTCWGFRLTYNFYIKGGFSGGEDYRWAVVRTWFPGWKWEVFNYVFICMFQQFTILAQVAPAIVAMQSDEPLGPLDFLAAGSFLFFSAGETIADRQMWVFQTEKYRRKNAGEALGPYEKGFVDTGLWGISRHPNYFCEVTMWWCFYIFSIAATGRALNWTIWGAIFLTGLFVPPGASADVTEMLSSAKYQAYKEYQTRVSRFFPWFPSSTKKD